METDDVNENKPPDIRSLFNNRQKFSTKFLLMSLCHENKSFNNYSPFPLCKFIKGFASNSKIKFLRNGQILIEVSNERDLINLNNIKNYDNIPIQFAVHKSLNYSKGIISCFELSNCSEEEIKSELVDQGVVHVKRIYKKGRDNNRSPTNTFILTFESNKLPTHIDFEFLRVKVRPFEPLPVQCYNCFKFRHYANGNNCQVQLCGRCGHAKHENQCTSEVKCINCNQQGHPAWSRTCPAFMKEKEIEKIRTSDRVTYRRAEIIYNQRFKNINNDNNIQYSQVVERQTISQTTTEILTEQLKQLAIAIQNLTEKVNRIERNGNLNKNQQNRNEDYDESFLETEIFDIDADNFTHTQNATGTSSEQNALNIKNPLNKPDENPNLNLKPQPQRPRKQGTLPPNRGPTPCTSKQPLIIKRPLSSQSTSSLTSKSDTGTINKNGALKKPKNQS